MSLSAVAAEGSIVSLRDVANKATASSASSGGAKEPFEYDVPEGGFPPDNLAGAIPPDNLDGAPDGSLDAGSTASDYSIPNPSMSFEGISNADQELRFSITPSVPDTVGDVGKDHYVQMVNVAVGIYSKDDGTLALPLVSLAQLWDGVSGCDANRGDPIVLYDQFEDRWLLSQFGLECGVSSTPCYICLAVSTSGDPTGGYYRYKIPSQTDPLNPPDGTVFPDYPKYSIYGDSIIITTRDFPGPPGNNQVAVSVYALDKAEFYDGVTATFVRFVVDKTGDDRPRVGDGLLPADVDGSRPPPPGSPVPILGDQDDDRYGSSVTDAINVWELSADWANDDVELVYRGILPVDSFDSVFPCPGADSRDCLPQPGVTDTSQYLDVQSIRQRLLHRLAYRNFGSHESIVATRAVEARTNQSGMRWYEIQRKRGSYSIAQQGTFAPDDGVNRWMGSIAQDGVGNIALGYSVANGESNPFSVDAVFPGIRYTGRLADDPPGVMTLGEANLAVGSGVQQDPASRWGDYSSMNIDPEDDCTFWYTNEYYTATGQLLGTRYWQTRIGSFTLPGCNDSYSKGSKSKKGSKSSKSTKWKERKLTKGYPVSS